MQTITTNEWTQITGLDGSKTYVLQAQYKGEYDGVVYGSNPQAVMWIQAGSTPQADDIGVITDMIKVSGSVNVYVKSQALPVNIIKQEVI